MQENGCVAPVPHSGGRLVADVLYELGRAEHRLAEQREVAECLDVDDDVLQQVGDEAGDEREQRRTLHVAGEVGPAPEVTAV